MTSQRTLLFIVSDPVLRQAVDSSRPIGRFVYRVVPHIEQALPSLINQTNIWDAVIADEIDDRLTASIRHHQPPPELVTIAREPPASPDPNTVVGLREIEAWLKKRFDR